MYIAFPQGTGRGRTAESIPEPAQVRCLAILLCFLLLGAPAGAWGLKKELLDARIRRICLTYVAMHRQQIRYRIVQDAASRRRFPSRQIGAEVAAALQLWCQALGHVRPLITRGECDLLIELGPTPPGDTSHGAFTAVDEGYIRVRINTDHVWHESRDKPGLHPGKYPWRPFPSLNFPGPDENFEEVAQKYGLTRDVLFWTSYRALIHEFGHAFGLADTDVLLARESQPSLCSPGEQPSSIMRDSTYFHLTPDDLEGLRQVQLLCKHR